jgi:hypothetical protein
MSGFAARLLGAPPGALLAEARREVAELRCRWPVVRSAARGASVVSRVRIDRGTLVLDGRATNGIVSDVTVIGLPPAGKCRCRPCRHLRGSSAVYMPFADRKDDQA